MPVVYNTTVKNSRMTVVRDAIDVGAGPGELVIATAGFGTVLVTLDLNDPCGAVADGVLALTPPSIDAIATITGTAGAARIVNGDGLVVVDGLTVGTTSADVLLTSAVITADEPVELVSVTIAHG
jgi:hypothetical protein